MAMPARFGVTGGPYLMGTVHRAENTDVPERLSGIMAGLGAVARDLGTPLLLALHPRTLARLASYDVQVPPEIRVLPPLGYLEFLGLQASAAMVLGEVTLVAYLVLTTRRWPLGDTGALTMRSLNPL